VHLLLSDVPLLPNVVIWHVMYCLLFFSNYKPPRKPTPIAFPFHGDRCPRKLMLVGNELLRKLTCFFLVNECGKKLLLLGDDYATKINAPCVVTFLCDECPKNHHAHRFVEDMVNGSF